MTESLQARAVDESIVKRIEELAADGGNKSEIVREAVRRYVHDPDIWDDRIAAAEQERDRLLEEKQRVERELERARDRITDLKDRRQEARTLRQVEKEIPDHVFGEVANRVQQQKYSSDPRSSSEAEVIEHNAERLANDYGLEIEKVRKVLRLRVNA